MRGRSFAFTASRLAQFKEARTRSRIGNGERFLEVKQVAVVRPDTTYSFVRAQALAFDFNTIQWGVGRTFSYDFDGVLHVFDGGAQAGSSDLSSLSRTIQLGQQVMECRRGIIRGFNTGWMLNRYAVNPGLIQTFFGFIDIGYPVHYEIPIPAAPNTGPGDSGVNLLVFGTSPQSFEDIFADDLIGWPIP